MTFSCPHCGAPLTITQLDAEGAYQEAKGIYARLGERLGVLAEAYCRLWAPPGRRLQSRKETAILRELLRLKEEKAFSRRRKPVPFEEIDLLRALEALSLKPPEGRLTGHGYLHAVIGGKRESRLSWEEKKADERRRQELGRAAAVPPLDTSALPGFLRGTAERKGFPSPQPSPPSRTGEPVRGPGKMGRGSETEPPEGEKK